MASGFGNYLIQKLLNQIFSGSAYTFPTSLDLALTTGNTSTASAIGTEVSGGSYARLQVTASTNTFPTISGSTTTITNSGASPNLTFATSTASWGTVTTVVVVEHGNSNIMFFGDLATAQTVNNNNVFQFTSSNFSVQLV